MVSYVMPCASIIVTLLGVLGLVVQRRNMISMMLCLELVLLGLQSYGIWLSHALHLQDLHAWVLAVMVIAAVEMSLGLAIIIMIYQQTDSINSDDLMQLKE